MCLAHSAVSEVALSAIRTADSKAIQSDFSKLLNDSDAGRTFLVEVKAYNTLSNSEETIRFASKAFITRPSDTPPNVLYDPALFNVFSFRRSVDSVQLSGGALPSVGSIEIVNTGDYDDKLPPNFSYDGRNVTVKLGGSGFNFSAFGTVYKGVIQSVSATRSQITINLRDVRAELSQPIQSVLYEGSGGIEGPEELKGTPKPKCFGRVRQIQPVLVQEAKRIYQISSGPVESISDLRDNGSPLNFQGNRVSLDQFLGSSPTPGGYATYLDLGLIRLGSNPVGVITCDAEGEKNQSGEYAGDISSVVKNVAKSSGVTDFNEQDFSKLTAIVPGDVGYYSPGQSNAASIIDSLTSGAFSYWGADRQGKLTVAAIRAPLTSSLTLTEREIFEFSQDDTLPPVWRVNVTYRPNWRPLTTDEVAGSVKQNDNILERLTRDNIISSREDASIKDAHPLAREITVNSYIDDESLAEKLRDRLWAMLSVQRMIYTVVVSATPLSRRLGDTVTVTDGRFVSNKKMVIIDISEEANSSRVTLRLWG